MTGSILRRDFLGHAMTGLGMALVGGALSSVPSALAASPIRKTPNGDLLETVPRGGLPSFARNGGAGVEEAYRYARENGETLRYIPCFCGCKSIGHRSNEDCYVTERHPDGRITFNSHSAG